MKCESHIEIIKRRHKIGTRLATAFVREFGESNPRDWHKRLVAKWGSVEFGLRVLPGVGDVTFIEGMELFRRLGFISSTPSSELHFLFGAMIGNALKASGINTLNQLRDIAVFRSSELKNIPQLGKKSRRLILEHFGIYQRSIVKDASRYVALRSHGFDKLPTGDALDRLCDSLIEQGKKS